MINQRTFLSTNRLCPVSPCSRAPIARTAFPLPPPLPAPVRHIASRRTILLSAFAASDDENDLQKPSSPELDLNSSSKHPLAKFLPWLAVPALFIAGWAMRGSFIQRQAHRAPYYASMTAAGMTTTSMSSKQHRPSSVPLDVVVRYRLLQLFSMPTYGKVLAIVAVAVPTITLTGYVYSKATNSDVKDSALKAYYVLNNVPGCDCVNEDTPQGVFILNVLYLLGILFFAVLIGVVTDDIGSAVDEVRSGSFPVVERSHTVLLGWNQQMGPVLHQIELARHERGSSTFSGPVVILAHTDKADMDAVLDVRGMAGRGLQVLTRSGNPARLEDLRRVAAADAATVIVLHPDHADDAAASAQKAATLAALKAAGGFSGQSIIIQAGHDRAAADYNAATVAVNDAPAAVDGEAVAPQPEGGSVVVVNNIERINQLLAQCTYQPGLSGVLGDLLRQSHDGAEFYSHAFPELEGKTFGEARRSFRGAAVCGIGAANGTVHLNPSDDAVIRKGDRLVCIAPELSNIRLLPQPMQVELPKLAAPERCNNGAKDIVVLSFDGKPEVLLKELLEFGSDDVRITVVVEGGAPAEWLTPHGSDVRFVDASPAAYSALQRAGVGGADSVVLSGVEDVGGDVQLVASVLQLQSLAKSSNRSVPLNVLSTASDRSTADVLRSVTASTSLAGGSSPLVAVDLLLPDELLSGMLTQVAAEPQLQAVFSEMFASQDGCEIYLRQPSRYGLRTGGAGKLQPQPLQWAQLAEAVRLGGECPIGIFTSEGRLCLGPDMGTQWALSDGDRLVVLAEC